MIMEKIIKPKSGAELKLSVLLDNYEAAKRTHGANSPEAKEAYDEYKSLYYKLQQVKKEWNNE